jgi:putative ABC transport system permease protein
MTSRTLICRSLRFHRRAHLGVVLGAAVGSAALVGALVVGDSLKGSLRERALERIGNVWAALAPVDRTVTEQLATKTEFYFKSMLWRGLDASGGRIRPLLSLDGTAAREDGAARVNRVAVFGVDAGFSVFGGERWREPIPLDSVVLNGALAERLAVKPGDQLLIRVPKSSAASREVSLVSRSDSTTTLRLRVQAIVSPSDLGNLSLTPQSSLPANAFVPLATIQKAADLEQRANRLFLEATEVVGVRRIFGFEALARGLWAFVTGTPSGVVRSRAGYELRKGRTVVETSQLVNHALSFAWTMDDADARLHSWSETGQLELRTRRVFLDPPLGRAALAADTHAQPLLTYLATLLVAGTNATPYSMVTAAGPPWTPPDMRDDEILVSQWLAEDLQVKPGDEIAMSYFLPESGARLEEATNTFRVHSIVPPELPWADRTLMPDFPGIEKAESTSDWDAGFPLTYKIRPKDEDYWKQHRGTPKAFITLAAGQKMWGNRFGNLTAIRFRIPTNVMQIAEGRAGSPLPAAATNAINGAHGVTRPTINEEYRDALEKKILANLKPEELGLRFEPVREQALKAAEGAQDFGGLFLGFSFFLIAAALVLMALLFSLGLEQRAPESGTLLALGFTPKQVRNLLLGEGVMLAFIGGVLGAVGGIYFAKAMLHGLATVWRDAVGATALSFHFTGQTLVIGIFASVVVSAVTIWLALRKFVKRPARELLVGEIGTAESKAQSLKSKVIAMAALMVGGGLAGWAVVMGETANAGIFFGAGALVLVAGLGFAGAWLAKSSEGGALRRPNLSDQISQGPAELGPPKPTLSLASLALRGCARRRKRSLATVAMLACGSFLIVSIGVFRLDANRDAWKRSSGTGGFALIGETTMPVVQNLNAKAGREFFALDDTDLPGVSFVPFRVRAGDEASCLNLNAAQRPRLLGVRPELLAGRFSFAKGAGWARLKSESRKPKAEIEIPAIGDANSIQWAMKKKVGDTLDYVDERGQPFKVRIVGAVANSILQGQLIIDEAEFVQRFPGESGYRMFLIDAPSNRVSQVSATLSRALQDVGLELSPAAQRLAQFNAVQNTYLGTFQVLGGLGLLLGSVGLGIVVLRNVLERRGELAVLLAVGWRKPQVQRLLLLENGALLAAGLALGIVAAAVAVLPALLSPTMQLPWASLALTLVAVLINGALWTWAATRLAVRGDLLQALRNE